MVQGLSMRLVQVPRRGFHLAFMGAQTPQAHRARHAGAEVQNTNPASPTLLLECDLLEHAHFILYIEFA